MLCCFDASVADEAHADPRGRPTRPKKKNTFEEVELRMGSYEHMNGRIPMKYDDSLHPSSMGGEETPRHNRGYKPQHQQQHENEQHQNQQQYLHQENLQQQVEDDTLSQMDLLQHQLQQIERERDDYRDRLSWYASSNLKDNNPNIVDLSDPNRPDAICQRMTELYDNQWTDAYIYLTDNGMDEKAALGILVNMLRTVYRVCNTLATQQMNSLGSQIGFFTGFEQIPPYLLTTVQMYKDERKKNYKKFLPVLEKKARKYVKTVRGLGDYFFLEALEICWLLCIQDPPMVLDFACYPGDVFDSKSFRPFTTPGSHVDFIVWPALKLYANGPLLTKGFAQGRKGGIATHHNVTRRLTSEMRPEHGSTYRRRDNSAQLSRISESSQEYQTSFMSSNPSEYSKSHSSARSSNRYLSTYDSLSQVSRSGSLREQQRGGKDYMDFLKNADFKANEETDSYMNDDQQDMKETERFVIPGRNQMYSPVAKEIIKDSKPVNVSPNVKTHENETPPEANNLNTTRTYIDEETQTSDNGIGSPSKSTNKSGHTKSPVSKESSLSRSPSHSRDGILIPDRQDTKGDASNAESTENQCRPSDSKTPDAFGDSKNRENKDITDINDNIISEPLQSAQRDVHTPSTDCKASKSVSKEKSAISGILKVSGLGSTVKSPSGSAEPSAIRGTGRTANEPIMRPRNAQSAESANFNANKNKSDSNTNNESPSNDMISRGQESTVSFLTVKINKIKRIPKRIYADDSLNSANGNGPNKNVKRLHQTSAEQKNTPNPDFTPRNVPSVESGGNRSLSTIMLSRNTLRQSTENTPRTTIRTVTPVQGHPVHVNSRHKKAFENDPEMPSEVPEHTPNKEHFGEGHGRGTGDDSLLSGRISDRGYVSRAITDYTPRNRSTRYSPVVKQYPAMKPDFSNTIKLMPENSFILAPKPPPKIPGTVAAKLRFATH